MFSFFHTNEHGTALYAIAMPEFLPMAGQQQGS